MEARRRIHGDSDDVSNNRFVVPFRRIRKAVLLSGLAIIVLITLFGLKSVQAYESCLLVRNGEIKEEWNPGLH